MHEFCYVFIANSQKIEPSDRISHLGQIHTSDASEPIGFARENADRDQRVAAAQELRQGADSGTVDREGSGGDASNSDKQLPFGFVEAAPKVVGRREARYFSSGLFSF